MTGWMQAIGIGVGITFTLLFILGAWQMMKMYRRRAQEAYMEGYIKGGDYVMAAFSEALEAMGTKVEHMRITGEGVEPYEPESGDWMKSSFRPVPKPFDQERS